MWTSSGCKDRRIGKFEIVTKTQFFQLDKNKSMMTKYICFIQY